MKLSIIIPVFNEEKTILEVLKRVDSLLIRGVDKEVIVVDDGSIDKTTKFISRSKYLQRIKFIRHPKNLGKGAAVRSGISKAKGEYIIIQDADLEYNPKDIISLISPVLKGKANVVYGTRLNRLPDFSRDEKTFQFLIHYFGNKFLSFLTSFLYGQWITDMETGYKLFPRKALENIDLKSRGFDFEPEITAKLSKEGYKITESPISTNPRGYNEGKKLNTVRDGILALFTLIKYKFSD